MTDRRPPGHLRSVLARRYVRHVALVAVAVVASAMFAAVANRREVPSPWVEAGTLVNLEAEGVVYLAGPGIFVVANGRDPWALHQEVPHLPGDRALWCPTAEVFEEIGHGSKFDRTGAYMDGPASRGLDEAPVRIEGEQVLVNPARRIRAPGRGGRPVEEPSGPFCIVGDDAPVEDPPGFARHPD